MSREWVYYLQPPSYRERNDVTAFSSNAACKQSETVSAVRRFLIWNNGDSLIINTIPIQAMIEFVVLKLINWFNS